MTKLSNSRKTSFQLILPVVPGTNTVDEQNQFRLNIFGNVLPGISIKPLELPWQGGNVFAESGDIEYNQQWKTSFIIDQNFYNYLVIYDWMMLIIDGFNKFAAKFEDYQVDGSLLIFDNWDNNVLSFKFKNIWPSSISDIDFSYQDGNEILKSDITFTYDWFTKII